MKRFFIFLLLISFCLSIFSFVSPVQAEEIATTNENKVEYVFFHSETCPHCKDQIKFINTKLMKEYGDFIDLKMYEVSKSSENQQIFQQYIKFYNVQTSGVPVAFIDGEVVVGFANNKTTGNKIMGIVENKLSERGLLEKEEKINNNSEYINIPFLGEIDLEQFSLPVLTIIIGLLDGFNPCAMWVLLFLITLLLGMEDKKRMWLLGSIFIFSSALVYFIFMAAWLQFLMFMGMVVAIRIIIGLVAVGVGGKSLKDFWKSRKTEGVVCEVSSKKNTQKIFAKIKDIVYKKSLWWSILGILLLGFSVNLVELACSAGFPAIFTQVLALNEMPIWKKYMYMVGYIFFYMLDDLLVFFIAMSTLKSKVFGTKYAKYTNLVGGLLILILGLLLIFKPEWLMFS